MKILHYNLYNDGRIGMCNLLMSVECAVAIAILTKRDKILFYGSEKLFNTHSSKSLFDLYDINFPYELMHTNQIEQSILSLPANLHNTVLYHTDRPTPEFVNNRQNIINLLDFEVLPEFRTLDNQTLAFYSYLFYFGNRRYELVQKIKEIVVPKIQYVNIAKQHVDEIKKIYKDGFNSLHIRRGDYLYTENRNRDVTGSEITENVREQFKSGSLLVVHTDEKELSYFDSLKSITPNVWFIDQDIAKSFPHLDITEVALISLLIASHSDNFVGTWFSTFTSYIQRYRLYNGLKEEFKFAYTQDISYPLEKNKIKSGSFGETTWNRAEYPERLKQVSFWINEWPESFPANPDIFAQQSLRLFPNFLSKEESEYIMGKMKYDNENEYYSRENRKRTTFSIHNDSILEKLARRACNVLGYDYNCIENNIQLFAQFQGGETFSHVDSVHSDYQGRRIASILFYLNDDYDGSFIDFAYLGTSIKPKAGTMIAYPLLDEFNEQNKLWTHSASLITKGTKLMCYFSLKEKPFTK